MLNLHYQDVKDSYLFTEIAHRVSRYQQENPQADIIRLGIGDVTRPLCPAVTQALHKAVDEMGEAATFRGYGPEQGYDFLRQAVQGYYAKRGVSLELPEIFISDGAKSDIGNLLDLFSTDTTVLVPDPVYPVYVDTNLMAGRHIIYADANQKNGFLPMPDLAVKADLIYLCSPNNPTGAVYNREQLKQWVDYANQTGAVILFDAAYECFIHGSELPHSIYEIEGARTCAIEICSLSKTAGFTGTRCGYTIVPQELSFDGMSPNKMWLRRQTTKFNGVPYIIQRGAAAVFSEEGQRQIKENIDYYSQNARIIASAMDEMGIWYTGGSHSPYIWLRCPGEMKSWEFFDKLLTEAHVVGTPGAGFGVNGEGFFRLTAFGDRARTQEAVRRFQSLSF